MEGERSGTGSETNSPVEQSAAPFVFSPAVTYPDSLGSHEDFSPVPSQVSSFESFSVSQLQLGHADGNLTTTTSRADQHCGDDDTSTATDISDWDGPQRVESELYIIVSDNTVAPLAGGQDIEQKTDKTISSVVRRRSIMLGPIDDSDTSDDDSDCSNSSFSDAILLDQSTLTTSTSHTTVLANEGSKDDVSDTRSVADPTQAILVSESITSDGKIVPLNRMNDELDDPPISATLSDALEEIDNAEVSAGEEQEGGDGKFTHEATLNTIEDKCVEKLSTELEKKVSATPSKPSVHKSIDSTLLMNENFMSTTTTSAVNEDMNSSPNVKSMKTLVPIKDCENDTSSSKTSFRSMENEYGNALDMMSSSSGDLLLTYSREDMLTSSDIRLDFDDTNLNNEFRENESSLLESAEADEWDPPSGSTFNTDERISFILEKMSLLWQRQNMISRELTEIHKKRIEERSKYKKKMRSIIKKLENDEAVRKKEKKKQNDRIELIENAVVELGRHYTGHYQPLLGAKSARKSTMSHQKAEKLKNFFGARPPLLHQFLKDLGYEEYIQRFENEKIGLQELGHLNEEDLADLGLPLGPRLRILHEAKQL